MSRISRYKELYINIAIKFYYVRLFLLHQMSSVKCVENDYIFISLYFIIFDLVTYHLATIGPICATEEPLVTGNTPIPDGQMTASSIYYSGVPAYYGRLNFNGAWCPSSTEISSSPPSMWIQVGR